MLDDDVGAINCLASKLAVVARPGQLTTLDTTDACCLQRMWRCWHAEVQLGLVGTISAQPPPPQFPHLGPAPPTDHGGLSNTSGRPCHPIDVGLTGAEGRME